MEVLTEEEEEEADLTVVEEVVVVVEALTGAEEGEGLTGAVVVLIEVGDEEEVSTIGEEEEDLIKVFRCQGFHNIKIDHF